MSVLLDCSAGAWLFLKAVQCQMNNTDLENSIALEEFSDSLCDHGESPSIVALSFSSETTNYEWMLRNAREPATWFSCYLAPLLQKGRLLANVRRIELHHLSISYNEMFSILDSVRKLNNPTLAVKLVATQFVCHPRWQDPNSRRWGPFHGGFEDVFLSCRRNPEKTFLLADPFRRLDKTGKIPSREIVVIGLDVIEDWVRQVSSFVEHMASGEQSSSLRPGYDSIYHPRRISPLEPVLLQELWSAGEGVPGNKHEVSCLERYTHQHKTSLLYHFVRNILSKHLVT
jgi:hypothetical protein